MKNMLTTMILLAGMALAVNAQTFVSGGVYSNTTWTQANSPYIVTDTTVVFPGVTLMIEPGVTMKFDDHAYLEIRQGTLIATGTATDSITFTSNSPAPVPGIWGGLGGGIYLNTSQPTAFNYCNVSYSTTGITAPSSVIQYLKNSTFKFNLYGMDNISYFPVDSCVFDYNVTGIGTLVSTTMNFCSISNNDYGVESSNNVKINNCAFDYNNLAFGASSVQVRNTRFNYCSISNNQTGLVTNAPGNSFLHCVVENNSDRGLSLHGGVDTVFDCEIRFNGTGIAAYSGIFISNCSIEYDTIGVLIFSSSADIHCNKICNNIYYGLKMNTSFNFDASNNYWCTTDSALIAAAIYDGYDNVVNGLVNFMPPDTLPCYTLTGIPAQEAPKTSIRIFPDPASDYLTIKLPSTIPGAEVRIFNTIGELVTASEIFPQETTVDVSILPAGIYFLELTCEKNIYRQKFARK